MSEDQPRFEDLPVGIDTNRLAKQKAAQLSERERNVYHWILRRLAGGLEVRRADLIAAARDRDLPPDAIAGRLEEQDLVLFDPSSDCVRCAYPFSGVPTGHEVRLVPSQITVHAMCAIDALGMPYMLGRSATISSRDPRTSQPVTVRIDLLGETQWEPASAVVVTGAARGNGSISLLCCPVINFFASGESASAFLEDRDDIDGTILTIPEAIIAGRAFFEGLLE